MFLSITTDTGAFSVFVGASKDSGAGFLLSLCTASEIESIMCGFISTEGLTTPIFSMPTSSPEASTAWLVEVLSSRSCGMSFSVDLFVLVVKSMGFASDTTGSGAFLIIGS